MDLVDTIKNLDEASEILSELESGGDFLTKRLNELQTFTSELRSGDSLGATAEEWSSYHIPSVVIQLEECCQTVSEVLTEIEDHIESVNAKVQEFTEEENACYE